MLRLYILFSLRSPGGRGPGVGFSYNLAGSSVSKGRPIYFPRLKPTLNLMRTLYGDAGEEKVLVSENLVNSLMGWEMVPDGGHLANLEDHRGKP